jgi:hypothetical protein
MIAQVGVQFEITGQINFIGEGASLVPNFLRDPIT